MQKYFDNLDDYTDQSRHPVMDKVICYMKMALIFLASLALLFAVCGSLEVMREGASHGESRTGQPTFAGSKRAH
jgi:FtsH-binding integral membrane protein